MAAHFLQVSVTGVRLAHKRIVYLSFNTPCTVSSLGLGTPTLSHTSVPPAKPGTLCRVRGRRERNSLRTVEGQVNFLHFQP